MVVMRLVVLVPFIAGVHSVEVLGLAGSVLVMPPVHLRVQLQFASKRSVASIIHVTHQPLALGLELACAIIIYTLYSRPHGCFTLLRSCIRQVPASATAISEVQNKQSRVVCDTIDCSFHSKPHWLLCPLGSCICQNTASAPIPSEMPTSNYKWCVLSS